MKTQKIKSGVYKLTDRGETFIIKLVDPISFDSRKYKPTWQAWGCENENECSDNNSCCVSFSTKKEIIKWIINF